MHSATEKSKKRDIVIIGAGAIGACTAYYLTQHPQYDSANHRISIIESSGVASGSSGKGGGLIAAWAEPQCLARASFNLHEELAQKLDGAHTWGYRRVTCAECKVNLCSAPTSLDTQDLSSFSADRIRQKIPTGLHWLSQSKILDYEQVGSTDDTAQCHPREFTQAILDEAMKHGVQLVHATVMQVEQDVSIKRHVLHCVNATLQGVVKFEATDVVVAAGPWSSKILPEASVSGARCHSIIIRPRETLSNNLLFVNVENITTDADICLTPEVYPRADGTVYACESADPTHPLPDSAASAIITEQSCTHIWNTVSRLSPSLAASQRLAEQVCYQPIVVYEGERKKLVGPFLGPASIPGMFLACGHDSWGISNAPATGLALSELLFDGISTSINIKSLSTEEVMKRAQR